MDTKSETRKEGTMNQGTVREVRSSRRRCTKEFKLAAVRRLEAGKPGSAFAGAAVAAERTVFADVIRADIACAVGADFRRGFVADVTVEL